MKKFYVRSPWKYALFYFLIAIIHIILILFNIVNNQYFLMILFSIFLIIEIVLFVINVKVQLMYNRFIFTDLRIKDKNSEYSDGTPTLQIFLKDKKSGHISISPFYLLGKDVRDLYAARASYGQVKTFVARKENLVKDIDDFRKGLYDEI